MYDFLKNSINKKNLRIIYFVAFIYFLNRFFLKKFFYENIFINGYLNDLLVMPLIFSSFALSASILKVRKFPSGKYYYFFVFLICSLVFEIIRPFFIINATFDYIDFLCYGIGSLVHYAKFR